MDNGILNQPPESAAPAPGAVVKGERVMGGGFVPQFGVAGGNAYKSIFAADESKVAEGERGCEGRWGVHGCHIAIQYTREASLSDRRTQNRTPGLLSTRWHH